MLSIADAEGYFTLQCEPFSHQLYIEVDLLLCILVPKAVQMETVGSNIKLLVFETGVVGLGSTS